MRYNIRIGNVSLRSCIAMGVLAMAGMVASDSIHAQATDPAVDSIFATASYATYSPEQCASATVRITKMVRRKLDTTRYTPKSHFPIPQVQDATRRCLAAGRWDVNTLDLRQIPAFYRLVLFVGDTVTAHTAFTRYIMRPGTPDEQIHRLATIGNQLTFVTPIDYRRFDDVIGRLEAIPGQSAAHEAGQLIFGVLLLEGDNDVVLKKYLDHMGGLLNRLAPDEREGWKQFVAGYQLGLAYMNGDTVKRNGVAAKVPLNGQAILGPSGPYPIPHKINIVVSSQATGLQTVAAMHRLQAKYGDTIAVVYLQKTMEHFKLQGPLSYEEEANLLRGYYRDSLHVTDPVLLEKSPVQHRPSPDERLIYGPTPNDLNSIFDGGVSASIMLIDGNGTLRSFYAWAPFAEIRLEEGIERILRPKKGVAMASQK